MPVEAMNNNGQTSPTADWPALSAEGAKLFIEDMKKADEYWANGGQGLTMDEVRKFIEDSKQELRQKYGKNN
ncbi:MAG: hypothetical protein LBM77_12660 [Spirochaetaceae bacterium]|jgi:hypothetical protein|nr:hypothetical protein [Spirochaetaceae bacterium]